MSSNTKYFRKKERCQGHADCSEKTRKYYESKEMKCPKCGCPYIHTWLVAICYHCGYEGSRLEFAITEDCIKREIEFKKKIPILISRFKRLQN